MKQIYLFTLLTLLLAACTDDDLVKRQGAVAGEGLVFTVEVPEMVSTRSLGHDVTEEALQNMYLILFGEDGHYIGHYKATVGTVTSSDNGTAKANFSVPSMRQTESKRMVHFVAGNLNYDVLGELQPGDTEESAMKQITVTNNEAAYWQRVVFEDGFHPENSEDTNPVIVVKDPIKLVRNFCEVRLEASAALGFEENGVQHTITINGFALVNATDVSEVAPYNARQTDLNGGFVDYVGFKVKEGRPYKEFYEYTKHYGSFEVDDRKLETNTPTEYDMKSKFLYARNQENSKKQAYLLLQVLDNNETRYYKLDFSAKDPENNMVSVMNLYGNFIYKFKVTNIKGEGYAKAEDAMNAAAANNIASSIEVSETPNIADGLGNSLSVESLTMMITTTDGASMTYEYMHDNEENAFKDVKAVLYPEDKKIITVDENELQKGIIKITPTGALPSELQTQYVIITTPSGLSRRITVNVRQPFEFLDTRCQKYVATAAGSGLSCILALPPNLPISLFPLEIDIQPDDKVIYPDASQNKLPVGTLNPKEFHYQVIVEYNEYRLNNFVNCFFLTNQTLDNKTEVGIDVLCRNFKPSKMNFKANTQGPQTFVDAKITGSGNLSATAIPFEAGSEVFLTFSLSSPVEGENSIYFFTNYLETERGTIESGNGNVVPGNRATMWVFTPNEGKTGPFTVKFRTSHDVVGESFELTSSDMSFVPVLLPYRNAEAKVRCFLNNKQLQKGEVVSVYNDEYYTEKVTDLVVGGADGEYNGNLLHMLSFATYDRGDTVYFLYTYNNPTTNRAEFYREEVSADALIQAASSGQEYRLDFGK